jgi:hypothetical protein
MANFVIKYLDLLEKNEHYNSVCHLLQNKNDLLENKHDFNDHEKIITKKNSNFSFIFKDKYNNNNNQIYDVNYSDSSHINNNNNNNNIEDVMEKILNSLEGHRQQKVRKLLRLSFLKYPPVFGLFLNLLLLLLSSLLLLLFLLLL